VVCIFPEGGREGEEEEEEMEKGRNREREILRCCTDYTV